MNTSEFYAECLKRGKGRKFDQTKFFRLTPKEAESAYTLILYFAQEIDGLEIDQIPYKGQTGKGGRGIFFPNSDEIPGELQQALSGFMG